MWLKPAALGLVYTNKGHVVGQFWLLRREKGRVHMSLLGQSFDD
jgi:hypothetical protein